MIKILWKGGKCSSFCTSSMTYLSLSDRSPGIFVSNALDYLREEICIERKWRNSMGHCSKKYKQHCANRCLTMKIKSQAKRAMPCADTTAIYSGTSTPIFVCTPSISLSVMLTPSSRPLASSSLSSSSSFGSRLSIQSLLDQGLLQSLQAQPLPSGGFGSRLSILLKTFVASGGNTKGHQEMCQYYKTKRKQEVSARRPCQEWGQKHNTTRKERG